MMKFVFTEPFRELLEYTKKYIEDIIAQRDRLQQIVIRADISHFKDMSPEHKHNNPVEMERCLTESNSNFRTAKTECITMCERVATIIKNNKKEIEKLKQENKELKIVVHEHEVKQKILSCELQDTKRELEDWQSKFKECETIFNEAMDLIEQLSKGRHIQPESKDEITVAQTEIPKLADTGRKRGLYITNESNQLLSKRPLIQPSNTPSHNRDEVINDNNSDDGHLI